MNELDRRSALKALASGRALILDLSTWLRVPLHLAPELGTLRAIVYPHARAVSEARLGQGRGTQGVLRRDQHVCGYCLGKASTVDHVIPRCQGGGSTWFNLVAACLRCNQLKGGRTPEQAGMSLLRTIRGPRQELFEKFQALVDRAG
ncbi:MAG TPA: HNH endonuclease [Holophagaceae bacterium]|nr:HNH endonuclease [Holophagaceae bacterium]